MTSSPSGLQTLLDTCLRYANANSITFNSNKSVYMVFKPTRYRLFCPSMRMNDDVINPSDNVKYLGVILNDKLRDDDDMSKHLRNLYARSNVIIRKFHHCSIEVKCELFISYCVPTTNIHTLNYALLTIICTEDYLDCENMTAPVLCMHLIMSIIWIL